MTTAPIAFVDCETTSLRFDRRAWEIAVILRKGDGSPDVEQSWLIDIDHLELGNADLASLKIGRFFERHPHVASADPDWNAPACHDEGDALREVEFMTRGAHIVGAVPNFDTEVLGNRMRANGICPSSHYHVIDVETLAVGWLRAQIEIARLKGMAPVQCGFDLRELAAPPWKSDDLAAALGLKVSEDARHTALGDARFARDIYDAVMGSPVTAGGA